MSQEEPIFLCLEPLLRLLHTSPHPFQHTFTHGKSMWAAESTDGTTTTLEVSNVCKGAGLKELIATRFGTPPERQQLILHGRAIMHLLSQTRQRVPGRCPAT